MTDWTDWTGSPFSTVYRAPAPAHIRTRAPTSEMSGPCPIRPEARSCDSLGGPPLWPEEVLAHINHEYVLWVLATQLPIRGQSAYTRHRCGLNLGTHPAHDSPCDDTLTAALQLAA